MTPVGWWEHEEPKPLALAARVHRLAEAREAVLATRIDLPTWDPAAFWELLGTWLWRSPQHKHHVAHRLATLKPAEVEHWEGVLLAERERWPKLFLADELRHLEAAYLDGSLDHDLTPEDCEAAARRHHPCLVPVTCAWRADRGDPIDLDRFSATLVHSRSMLVRLAWASAAVDAGLAPPSILEALAVVDLSLPWGAPLFVDLGDLLDDLDQPAQAEAAYREATRRWPDFSIAWRGLAHLLEKQGRSREAEAAHRTASTWESTHNQWNSPGELLRPRR